MRLAVSLELGSNALIALRDGLTVGLFLYHAGLALLGILLLVGLWTPIAGSLLTLAALGHLIVRPGDWRIGLIVAILAAALALLGPGGWSVDSRLYGWKRLEIPSGKEDDTSR
jgi:putative oxidoreductase